MAFEFEQMVTECGFSTHIEKLRSHLQPCIGITFTEGAENSIGTSRHGGGADLPPEFKVGVHRGRPLDFLLQINCAEVSQLDCGNVLPQTGLLSFFYDNQNQPWGIDSEDVGCHKVYYFPNTQEMKRRHVTDKKWALPEAAMKFCQAHSLPDLQSIQGERLLAEIGTEPWKDPISDAYRELFNRVLRVHSPMTEGPISRLGGHPALNQGEMQLEAELISRGMFFTRFEDPRREKLKGVCGEWQLLLQLDSELWYWADVGKLYFWAKRSDLVQQNYSRTWLRLQC